MHGRSARQLIAAFTLVEVLISILVLALGLLGLGAVFPVIIRSQRIATDQTQGVIMANNVAAEIRTRFELSQPLKDWRLQMFASMGGTGVSDYTRGVWQTVQYDRNGSGELAIPPAGFRPSVRTRSLLARDRLLPAGASDPAYIWDIAAQPIDDGDGDFQNDRLRIAIFIRRIDPRIRDISDVVDGTVLPLAVDPSTGLPVTDRPGGDQDAEYAAPVEFTAGIRVNNNEVVRDRFFFAGTDDEIRALVGQPGQRVVDRYGNVYTVQEVGREDGAGFFRVEPPVDLAMTERVARGPFRIVSFVTTPQPPVAVEVFEVTP